MREPNPFRPTAGAPPPALVDRERALREFSHALADGPGAPGRLTLVTGARGMGKTVLLGAFAQLALQEGWVHLSDTAYPGLADRLARAADRHVSELGNRPRTGRSVTGVTLPVIGGGLSVSPPAPAPAADFRATLTTLLEILRPHGTGVLITIDEVHNIARADLREVAASVQHLISEEREIAVALAGLPSAISALLNDDVLSFLRRATPVNLGELSTASIEESLVDTITEHGGSITPEAVERAAEATEGYPFLVQLIGYYMWREARDRAITLDTVARALPQARTHLSDTVLATALADLSGKDREFLVAMAEDDGPSRLADVAARMNRSVKYASAYRARLIDARVIVPVAHGVVDFALPYLREFLRST